MEKGNNKNAVLLTVIGIATLLIAIVGATFAYFSAQVVYDDANSSTLTIVSAHGGTSTYQGGEEIVIENIYPRDAAWVQKTIKITYANSTTNLNYTYHLDLNYANTFTSGYLSYEFKAIPSSASTGVCLADGSLDAEHCTSGDLIKSTSNGTLIATTPITGTFNNTNGAATSIPLRNGVFAPTSGNDEAVHVYLLTIWFENASQNQNDSQNKIMSASIGYSEVHGS